MRGGRVVRARPEFDIDFRYGQKGEELVRALFQGMLGDEPGRVTVEVKTDARYLDTQKIYIEYECRTKDGWTPSGIASTKAEYWSFVLGETVIISLPVAILRACYEKALAADERYGHRKGETDGGNPTHGVVIPLNLFLTWVYMELARREKAA